ncbi:MAG: glycosyltransferase family 4 protein [Mucilaginibacter sp.]|jgi:glycosyltransferase involved in cell wall biosynthesis|uniref:glycosyltransferase family 4 protein n=1 Tax=Mucilaginibacter sp. TaxID=1882438 RepID=UPI00356A84AD
MEKLAIIVSHPIQYYAPLFKLLHERNKIHIKVFYTWGPTAIKKYDPGFNRQVDWDIPLLEGYPFEWVENIAGDPGSHHFKGIVTPSLISRVDKWRPTSLLVFGWAYESHLKCLRYYKGKLPVYFRGDSTLIDQKNNFRRLFRAVFLTWLYRYVDHVFFVGANNRAYFKKYGLKEDQLSFAPHAVENERFGRDHSEEVLILKNQLGILPADLVILFAAKLEEKKDPLLLMNAFLQLNQSGIHLIFAGSGPLESILKKMASGNKSVHFIGFQNQKMMPVLYQACDLFCLPSRGPGETWGLAVNEAMASGRAVLASDKVGSADDLVTDKNGKIFKNGNLEELKDALKDLLGSKARLQQLGQGSAQIIANYSLRAVAVAIESQLMKDAVHPNNDSLS